ncbi:MAG: TetR/AcrR family transcriptional regulator [Acidimicrobiales bacterium]
MSTNRRSSTEAAEGSPRLQRDARRDERRDERRGDLLDAAIAAIRTIGPGATMEQLARAGGITKPILYRHFGDRDGLIGAIAARFSSDLLTSVTTPLAADADARELLRSTVDAYVGFIERDPNLYRFMIQHPQERAGGMEPVASLVDLIAKQVALVAGSRLREAGRDSGAAVPWAYGIVGLVHQAGDWWVDDQTMTRAALVDYLVSLLWDGLAGAGAAAERSA